MNVTSWGIGWGTSCPVFENLIRINYLGKLIGGDGGIRTPETG